jgi:hypothetical protein
MTKFVITKGIIEEARANRDGECRTPLERAVLKLANKPVDVLSVPYPDGSLEVRFLWTPQSKPQIHKVKNKSAGLGEWGFVKKKAKIMPYTVELDLRIKK